MTTTGPTITLARKTGAAAWAKRMAGLGKLAAYVGIPASTSADRAKQLLSMAGKVKNKKRKAKLEKAAESDVNNAELLFIFSKGSPARGQPARPVLEPAIELPENKKAIAFQIAGATKAQLAGDKATATTRIKKAALAGQNAARAYFTSGVTGWPDLADSTKRAKARQLTPGQRKKFIGPNGKLLSTAYTIGVDTGAMRAAIVGIVREE